MALQKRLKIIGAMFSISERNHLSLKFKNRAFPHKNYRAKRRANNMENLYFLYKQLTQFDN